MGVKEQIAASLLIISLQLALSKKFRKWVRKELWLLRMSMAIPARLTVQDYEEGMRL